MILEGLADLQRAQDRRLRIISENKRATVTGWQTQQFAFRFRQADLLRSANNFLQLLQRIALLVNQSFRITNDVDEQDVSDLKFYVGGTLGRHTFRSI